MIADRKAFIRANTRLKPVPHVPEISLYVADESVPMWEKTEEELGAIGLPPPFWAFAWAGGRGLARPGLDHSGIRAGGRGRGGVEMMVIAARSYLMRYGRGTT